MRNNTLNLPLLELIAKTQDGNIQQQIIKIADAELVKPHAGTSATETCLALNNLIGAIVAHSVNPDDAEDNLRYAYNQIEAAYRAIKARNL